MKMKASVTIEASFVLPLFLFVLMVSTYCLFYSHDKQVVSAAAYETVTVMSGREDVKTEEIEAYFKERVVGRTFLFEKINVKVEKKDKNIKLICSGRKRSMDFELEREMAITNPEDYIRTLRRIEKLKDKLGDEE